MSKKGKTVFLVHKMEDPSSRHRIFPVQQEMLKRGDEVMLAGVPDGLTGRIALIMGLAGTDLLIIHRKLFRPLELFFIKLLCGKIVYDFDDALMFIEVRWKRPLTGRRFRRFLDTIDACDAVAAGNEFLAAHTRYNCPDTRILTTPVDVERYVPDEKKRDCSRVVVGWIGMRGNLVYLRELVPVFRRLAKRFPDFALSIICDDFLDIEGVNVLRRRWSVEDEVAHLQEMDIGIMPLTDDLWSRGKCGFKILEYFSVGAPAVASPVGINADIVTHGVNGFLAGTPDEWHDHLTALIDDGTMRMNMGAEGRKSVVEKYSLRVFVENYLSLLDGLRPG